MNANPVDRDRGSIFLLLVQRCREQLLEPGALPANLGSRQRRLFGMLSEFEDERVRIVDPWCHFLGLTKPELSAAIGWDIAPTRAHAQRLMVKDLRYCPQCLAQGWHSSLFQHVGLTRCPLHVQPLVRGCSRCQHFIQLTPTTAAENHLYCATCGKMLGDLNSAPPVDCGLFTSLRKHFASEIRKGTLTRLKIRLEPVLRSMRLGNQLSLHAHGASPNSRFARASNQSVFRLSRETVLVDPIVESKLVVAFDNVAKYPRDVVSFKAAVDALGDIAVQIRDAGALDLIPRALNAKICSGQLISASVSLPTAALWCSAVTLGVPADLEDTQGPLVKPGYTLREWTHPYSSFFWGLPDQALVVLTRALTFAVYAEHLLALRHINLSTQIRWNAPPTTLLVLPWWRLLLDNGRDDLVVRTRASEAFVKRLIPRYGRRRLRAA